MDRPGLAASEEVGALAVTVDQRQVLSQAAALAGVNVTEYVRRAAVDRAERDRAHVQEEGRQSLAGALIGKPAGGVMTAAVEGAARQHAAAAEAVSVSVPDGARLMRWRLTGTAAAAQARELVHRTWLEWGLDPLAEVGMVMVSELVTNAVLHGVASGPEGDAGRVLLCLGLGEAGSEGVCGVADASPFPPRPVRAGQDAEGGRGLVLIAALSDACGWYRTAPGKMVWFSQRLRPAPVEARPSDGVDRAVFPVRCGRPHPVLGAGVLKEAVNQASSDPGGRW
ncbi:ATP-binding protein [Actinomadura napierensis]|uniref:ATP-binding protein n=1 Tax=Actinomadura napierensis TaxID=267854 RepID=UPI0031D9DCFC